jgi:hypothetical protein
MAILFHAETQSAQRYAMSLQNLFWRSEKEQEHITNEKQDFCLRRNDCEFVYKLFTLSIFNSIEDLSKNKTPTIVGVLFLHMKNELIFQFQLNSSVHCFSFCSFVIGDWFCITETSSCQTACIDATFCCKVV